MEAYIYTSSVRDFIRFKRIVIWIILSLCGFGLALLWPHLDNRATLAEQYTRVSEILVFRLLALASAIFTTAIVSQEVEQRTIVYLLTRPVQRWKLLLMRYLASASVVALLGIFAAFMASLGVYKGGEALTQELFRKDVIALVVGAFSYGALFLLVSLIINRAMIVCLLFAFGWETIVPNLPGEMYRLSVYSHILGIAEHPGATDQGSAVGLATGNLSLNVITPGSAYVTLGVMTIALVAISALWFTRFEFVPREDAE